MARQGPLLLPLLLAAVSAAASVVASSLVFLWAPALFAASVLCGKRLRGSRGSGGARAWPPAPSRCAQGARPRRCAWAWAVCRKDVLSRFKASWRLTWLCLGAVWGSPRCAVVLFCAVPVALVLLRQQRLARCAYARVCLLFCASMAALVLWSQRQNNKPSLTHKQTNCRNKHLVREICSMPRHTKRSKHAARSHWLAPSSPPNTPPGRSAGLCLLCSSERHASAQGQPRHAALSTPSGSQGKQRRRTTQLQQKTNQQKEK